MPSKQTIPFTHGTFFITFTSFNWLNILERADGYDCIYKWFDILKLKRHFINAYVLMPNHVHAVITFTYTEVSINTIVGNGKRFMAYELITKLKSKNEWELLKHLSDTVSEKNKLRNKLHEVWEPSFDWKVCLTLAFVEQKINYVHNNPCAGKWNLCINPADYMHSSAGFYETGTQGIYDVTNISEMEDVDFIGKNNMTKVRRE